jgi:serine/threonine protein kinase
MVSPKAIARSKLDRRYGQVRLGQSAIRVQDRLLERAVYLKVASGDPGERLLAEARVLSRLSHRNLVPLHELIAEGRVGETVVWGFATPALDGVPFPEGVARLAKTPLATALAGLVDCVAYIHHRGFLHLDLKPDNVLWADNHPIVIDLGVHQPVDAGRAAVG